MINRANWNETPLAAAIRDHQREQEMEAELYDAFAANEDDDGDDEEADDSSNFVQSIRAVSLEPTRNREYESFFYPKSERAFLLPVLESLSDVTANVNMFFRFMRLVMVYANKLSFASDESKQQIVSEIFTQVFSTRRDDGSVKETVDNFVRATRRSAHAFHTLTRSQRYPGGIDAVMLGTGKDPEEGMPAPYFGAEDAKISREHLLRNGPADDLLINDARRGRWQSPIGLGIIEAAKEIHRLLFGTSAVSDRMVHRGIPLDTKFTDIEAIWVKHTGLRLPSEMITDMVVTNPLAEQFLQIETIRQPSKEAVSMAAKLRKEAAKAAGAEQAGNAGVNERVYEAANSNQHVAIEAELLNVTLRTSIRFTLEADIAHFVTQTPGGEPVSLSRANSWFSVYIGQVLRAKKGNTKYTLHNTASIRMENVPRYATSASTLKKIPSIRQQNGFSVENTKGNAEGMYIQHNGTLGVRPAVDTLQRSTIAEDYERLSDEFLDILSRNDIPLAQYYFSSNMEQWPHVDPHDLMRLEELKGEIADYAGCTLGFDWDFGITVTAGTSPGVTNTTVSVGTVQPDSLAIADWLGFNMAKDGEKPMKRTFAQAMFTINRPDNTLSAYQQADVLYGAIQDPLKFTRTPVFSNIINTYIRAAYVDEKAPKLPEIMSAAMRALSYQELPKEGFDEFKTYQQYLKPDGSLLEIYQTDVRGVLQGLLEATVKAASGAQGTYIWNQVFDDLRTADRSPSSAEVSEELENHPDYFNSSISTTADFAKLFKYYGGQVYKQMLDAINAIPLEHWLNAKNGDKVEVNMGRKPGQERDTTIEVEMLSNSRIFSSVLPFTVMLGKYAPNSETIFAEAEEQVKSIEPDEGFDASDIKVPGLETSDARAIFPHQEDVQRYLRKKNPPNFAILALAPGGGKTGQGVIDISCLMQDMKEVGQKVVPLILCPNGLVPTWCEEMKYFLGANWNPFPITSQVLKRWGEKRLMEVALAAPPNTIFITSMSFIGGRGTKVSVGSGQVRLSQNLEMIRRLGINYVAIDESHNLKNFGSARHRSVKVLTSSTTVKWLRLLTGTILPDRAKDIEGQIALKAPHVFRAGDIANINPDAEAVENSGVVKIGDRVVATYTPLNGKRAVDKLSRYIAFIVKNKKDWAYMLPSAIEAFHPVPMVDFDSEDGTSPAEIEQQKLHEQLYRLVLDKTLEELKPLLRQKAKAEAAADKDDGSDNRDGEEDEGDSGSQFEENDSDFSGEKIKQKLWEKNLARFERLIIAPQYDEAYHEVFGDMAEGFVSRKAKYIVNLVHQHFNPEKWSRSKNDYTELDLVEHKGQQYVARKYTPGETRMRLPDAVIGVPPDEAPDYWKPEPKGKLIIITRYNHSASAVYDALPPHYKEQAVKFTGDEPDRVKSFNDFKTDDRIQILIANEQGMSEGHNLQLASRMIRAESPWGPGALNQTAARVWRPDAKGAIEAAKGTGGLTRDVVFLDWVLADNTMEVAKLARVISKAFGIARITEASNPLYQDLLNTVTVKTEKEDRRLSLSIDMLASTAGLDDDPFNQMEYAYRRLNAVEAKEFAEMRAKNKAEMLLIEAAPPLEGADTMEIRPFVPNMPVPDPHKWGLENVEVMMRDPEVRNNLEKVLRTKPVLTEFGTGRIVGFNTRGGKAGSLIVNLKNPPVGMDSRITVQFNMAFVATKNITPEQAAKYFDVNLAQTATEEARSGARKAKEERMERQRQEQEAKENREKEIAKAQEREAARVIKKERADGEKREENERQGKPLNEGIYGNDGVIKMGGGRKLKPTEDPNIADMVEDEDEEFEVEEIQPQVSLHPMYYHGFATLEAVVEEDGADLKALGFRHVPSYAFITISNKKKFHALYDWVYDNFEVSDTLNKMFEKINSAFEPGMKNTHKLWYSMELAMVTELPAFFDVNKRMSSNRKAIRIFPIFTEEHVMLCVDIRTNPGIVKHIGKAVPGVGSKWQKADGEWLYFGANKTDLRKKIAEVARSVTVSNKDNAIKELTEIVFKYKRKK